MAIALPHLCAKKNFPVKKEECLQPFQAALPPYLEDDVRSGRRNRTLKIQLTNAEQQFPLLRTEEGPDHLKVVQKETIRQKLREASFFHFPGCSLLHSNRKSAEEQQEDLASQHLSLPKSE